MSWLIGSIPATLDFEKKYERKQEKKDNIIAQESEEMWKQMGFFCSVNIFPLLIQQKTNWLLTGNTEEAVQPIDGLQGEWPLC